MSSTQTTTRETTTTTSTQYYWERRKGVPLWPIAVGAVGLIGLGLLQGFPIRHSMESNLESRATAVLAQAGVSGATADFTGQDGVLTGTVPAGTDVAALVAKVRALDGVRVVSGRFTSPAATQPSAQASPSPAASASTASPSVGPTAALPSVTAASSGGRLVLTGTVPSKDAAAALLAAAESTFGAGKVDDQLTVDSGVSSDGLAGLGAVIAALGKGSTATAALAQGALTLSGTVPAAAAQTAAVAAAATVTGDAGKVTDQLTVAPPPAPPAPTAPPAPSAAPGGVQAQLNALPPITFANASNTLTPAGYRAVQRAAAILKASPAGNVVINGFTDDVGDAEINRELSVGRAQTVRTTLIGLGVSGARLTFHGYGESRPKVPNTSEANRAVNRRVEFAVK